MTNEEIDRLAEFVTAGLRERVEPDVAAALGEAFFVGMGDAIGVYTREVAAVAYAEAARDACWYCRCTTSVPERDADGNWTHFDLTEKNAAGCAAGLILERAHALKDS